MATTQPRFKWSDEKVRNLIRCLQEYKSAMEFKNCDSNADKVKQYEAVRKSLAEIYQDDEPETFCPFFSE